MGLFGKPKCPRCGGNLEYTGYSWPYPEWRCPACINRNKEKKRISDLEKRIKELEKKEK
jgi:tRNA(Ile2) C34 agmatinyltransferase TiaS